MTKICNLCRSDEDDEIKFGKFHQLNGLNVHYYCLLLTSGLHQRGDDDEGILGFLPKDILSEIRRIKLLLCCYCKKPYANIGCCIGKCRRTFHTGCGIDKCQYQFQGNFACYCHDHFKNTHKKKHQQKEICGICCEEMGQYNPITSIKPVCCQNGWFHQRCISEFAKKAGYFFKCPLCNNENIFRENVSCHGIFIPDQDAAWELEPNAFAELLERPSVCQAEICVCPKSRDYTNRYWKTQLCETCGSYVAHLQCWKKDSNYTCMDCKKPDGHTYNDNTNSSASTVINRVTANQNGFLECDAAVCRHPSSISQKASRRTCISCNKSQLHEDCFQREFQLCRRCGPRSLPTETVMVDSSMDNDGKKNQSDNTQQNPRKRHLNNMNDSYVPNKQSRKSFMDEEVSGNIHMEEANSRGFHSTSDHRGDHKRKLIRNEKTPKTTKETCKERELNTDEVEIIGQGKRQRKMPYATSKNNASVSINSITLDETRWNRCLRSRSVSIDTNDSYIFDIEPRKTKARRRGKQRYQELSSSSTTNSKNHLSSSTISITLDETRWNRCLRSRSVSIHTNRHHLFEIEPSKTKSRQGKERYQELSSSSTTSSKNHTSSSTNSITLDETRWNRCLRSRSVSIHTNHRHPFEIEPPMTKARRRGRERYQELPSSSITSSKNHSSSSTNSITLDETRWNRCLRSRSVSIETNIDIDPPKTKARRRGKERYQELLSSSTISSKNHSSVLTNSITLDDSRSNRCLRSRSVSIHTNRHHLFEIEPPKTKARRRDKERYQELSSSSTTSSKNHSSSSTNSITVDDSRSNRCLRSRSVSIHTKRHHLFEIEPPKTKARRRGKERYQELSSPSNTSSKNHSSSSTNSITLDETLWNRCLRSRSVSIETNRCQSFDIENLNTKARRRGKERYQELSSSSNTNRYHLFDIERPKTKARRRGKNRYLELSSSSTPSKTHSLMSSNTVPLNEGRWNNPQSWSFQMDTSRSIFNNIVSLKSVSSKNNKQHRRNNSSSTIYKNSINNRSARKDTPCKHDNDINIIESDDEETPLAKPDSDKSILTQNFLNLFNFAQLNVSTKSKKNKNPPVFKRKMKSNYTKNEIQKSAAFMHNFLGLTTKKSESGENKSFDSNTGGTMLHDMETVTSVNLNGKLD